MSSTQAEIEREKEAAKQSLLSLYAFLRNFWGVVNSEPYVDNFHIRYICDVLTEYGRAIAVREPKPDLIINIPPGSSKSTMVSQMFPAWLWLHAPWAVVLCSSYSSSLSIDHSIKCRKIIGSERYQRFFGGYLKDRFGSGMLLTKDTEKRFVNIWGGERVAVSTGGAVTGKHGHLIIRDDPLNPEQAVSELYRQRANRYNDRTLSTRKVDKKNTPTITVMQRLHEDDSTGHDLAKEGKNVVHICLPAEVSDRVKPEVLKEEYVDGLLDPRRMDREVLEEMLVDLGSYGYSGQFDQAPSPEGGGMIKTKWFREYDLDDVDWSQVVVHFYLDSAYTSKQENDPSSLLAFFVKKNDLFVVRSLVTRLEFPELVRWIPEQMEILGASRSSRLMIEPKASGLSIGQSLRVNTDLNVIFDDPPKDEKVVRVAAVSPLWEAGRVWRPNRGAWIPAWENEMKLFPKGKHDDQVDCLEGATRNTIFTRRTQQTMRTGKA